MSATLHLALCLFPDVTALDYQGPVELFGYISPKNIARQELFKESPCLIDITYFSHTMDPIEPSAGPHILPMRTYDDVKDGEQFDIIFVPGGKRTSLGARPNRVQPALIDFVQRQAAGSKYILSVCTGSWILATCGLLEGTKATTNKRAFRDGATSDQIQWIAKARWVVDGKFWTSSGVTAGMDMANAFVQHLVGEEIAKSIRGIIELNAKDQDEDEFAAFYGLE
ncbi:hypothetical protein M422DRAFT_58665 [Sphaerobolus stellatus SS14]|nr:hypothetical protein M422DRAFT_58665 [Sphaerobolus stellatus SS14]